MAHPSLLDNQFMETVGRPSEALVVTIAFDRQGATGTSIVVRVEGATGYELLAPWVDIYGRAHLPPDLTEVTDCEWQMHSDDAILFVRGPWDQVALIPTQDALVVLYPLEATDLDRVVEGVLSFWAMDR